MIKFPYAPKEDEVKLFRYFLQKKFESIIEMSIKFAHHQLCYGATTPEEYHLAETVMEAWMNTLDFYSELVKKYPPALALNIVTLSFKYRQQ